MAPFFKKSTLCRWAGVAASVFILASSFVRADDADLSIRVLQTDHPSSFPPLLIVRVVNEAFTPLDLAALVGASQLVVDGKPLRRKTPDFQGPAGVAAVAQWEGCLSLEDYAPAIAPGKHNVRLKLGKWESKTESIRWAPPVNWRQGTLATRLRDVHEGAEALRSGVPRSCVETWFPVMDGGEQGAERVRYFLEPQIKVTVPYSSAGDGGHETQVVDGAPEIYQEARVAD